MKRTTVIFQPIANYNAAEIIFYLHKMYCKKPHVFRTLVRKMNYEQVHSIERYVSHHFWMLYNGSDLERAKTNRLREKPSKMNK